MYQDVPPWVSLPPSKLKAKVQRVRRRTGEIKEKCQVNHVKYKYNDSKSFFLVKIRQTITGRIFSSFSAYISRIILTFFKHINEKKKTIFLPKLI